MFYFFTSPGNHKSAAPLPKPYQHGTEVLRTHNHLITGDAESGIDQIARAIDDEGVANHPIILIINFNPTVRPGGCSDKVPCAFQ